MKLNKIIQCLEKWAPNFEPILYAFEIETHNPEDSSILP